MPKLLALLKQNQSGYMIYFLIVGIVALALFFVKTPYSPIPPEEEGGGPQFCRDLVKDPNPRIIEAPNYTSAGVEEGTTRRYKLVKERVPVSAYYFAITHHFFQPFSQTRTDIVPNQKFLLKIPNGENGRSYRLPSESSGSNFFVFADYGLLYLFYINPDGSPFIIDHFMRVDGVPQDVALVDLYIAEDKQLPSWVLECKDTGTDGITENVVYEKKGTYIPSQNPSKDKNELQLEYFLLNKYKLLMQAWWTPHCKPAIYLYPPKETVVSVKVEPTGFLTLTDPIYDPQKGWTVLARPDGSLLNLSMDQDSFKNYDYLYFESKTPDQLITKPTHGWVRKYEDLPQLYKQLLPKLGFNQKQQADFVEYWTKHLSKSPYYFVSLSPEEEVDTYEKLSISPTPDHIRRIRFYFEALDSNSEVPPLDISEWSTKNSDPNTFNVFEWGGMIKRDKNHPYTCAM